MKIQLVGLVVLAFLAGLSAHPVLDGPQLPRSLTSLEQASPQDWVSEDQIKVYSDRIVIEVPDAKWARFADTNSMDPIIDKGANGIQLVPTHPDQLSIGDVITYNYQGKKIIHRIVNIQEDSEGLYYVVQGDNNPEPDPVKVRFSDVDRVLIGIFY